MIKINYPKNKKKRDLFEKEYKNIWASKLNNCQQQLTNLLRSKQQYNNLQQYSFEDILTAPFNKLKTIADAFSAANFSANEINKIKSIFKYDGKNGYRDDISYFFKKYSDQLNLSTCYFCNIDFINTYSDIPDSYSFLDYLNNASFEELKKLKGIKNGIASRIIDFRSHNNSFYTEEDIVKNIAYITDDSLKTTMQSYFCKNDFGNFTLDHVIGKGKNPVLALSLYNLVPSCYVCNSKIKNDIDLITTPNNCNLSPSNNQFSFNKDAKFTFKLSTNSETNRISVSANNISTLLNNQLILDIDANNGYDHFIDLFRLKGRYKFHKKEAISLVERKKKYSKTQLRRFANLLKIEGELSSTIIKCIERDIFGNELFEGDLQQKPLTKLKRDIAKQIGIEGIKED